jgi:hypothetical protein
MRPRKRSFLSVIVIPILLAVFITPCNPALASDDRKDPAPLTVRIGVFVSLLFDFSLVNNSYNTELWVWFVFPQAKGEAYHPELTTDIVNAKSLVREYSFDETKGSDRWITAKYDATVIHNWDMTDFPFDEQRLTIDLEETDLDATKLAFVPDTENSKVNSSISMPGWRVVRFSVETGTRVDETSFGDPDLSKLSAYPQATVTITLRREGIRLLFNLLIAAYIAFILGILVLFLHPEFIDSRKVLITTAMITVIGNHYVVNATTPAVHTFTLIDKIMITTFCAICLIAVVSVVTTHYVRTEKTKTAVTINRIGRWGILCVYLAVNALLILRAVLK